MLDQLIKPIQPNEIEWRVVAKSKDGKITVAPYIDSRCVMKRLDAEFGPMGWTTSVNISDNNLTLTLSVKSGDNTCYKEDGVRIQSQGENDPIDPVKSAISDALKRAAVQLGLGRDLYEYPVIQIQSAERFIPSWAKPKLSNLVTSVISGSFNKEYILITQETNVEAPKINSNSKPELDGLKFAKMLAAVNAGKWKDVEQALSKYTVAPDYEKAIRAQIQAYRSSESIEEASTK